MCPGNSKVYGLCYKLNKLNASHIPVVPSSEPSAQSFWPSFTLAFGMQLPLQILLYLFLQPAHLQSNWAALHTSPNSTSVSKSKKIVKIIVWMIENIFATYYYRNLIPIQ